MRGRIFAESMSGFVCGGCMQPAAGESPDCALPGHQCQRYKRWNIKARNRLLGPARPTRRKRTTETGKNPAFCGDSHASGAKPSEHISHFRPRASVPGRCASEGQLRSTSLSTIGGATLARRTKAKKAKRIGSDDRSPLRLPSGRRVPDRLGPGTAHTWSSACSSSRRGPAMAGTPYRDPISRVLRK